jgi:hypothetical protein
MSRQADPSNEQLELVEGPGDARCGVAVRIDVLEVQPGGEGMLHDVVEEPVELARFGCFGCSCRQTTDGSSGAVA